VKINTHTIGGTTGYAWYAQPHVKHGMLIYLCFFVSFSRDVGWAVEIAIG